MSRGPRNGQNIDSVIAYLHGRIEREIESVCINFGIPFGALAERLTELLRPLGPQRPEGEVPLLRGVAARIGASVAEVEVVKYPHDDEASPNSAATLQDHRGKTVKSGRPRLSEEERVRRARERGRRYYAKQQKLKQAARAAKLAKAAKTRAAKAVTEAESEARRKARLSKTLSKQMRDFWAKMTPKERAAENARRQALRLQAVARKQAAITTGAAA